MSAGFEYDFDPRRTSGALYHLVATPSVRTAPWSLLLASDLTSPKSHILIEQFELTRMFDGFKSL